MKQMTVGELIKVTDAKLVCGSVEQTFSEISTDSRSSKNGDCFFALVGEKFDANSFIKDVALSGCRVIVASDEKRIEDFLSEGKAKDISILLVDDSLEALRCLAKSYLESLPLISKIGVTGSVGKTSTRDMIYYAMSAGYRTARSIKNFNNQVGLPLSVLSFPPDTEIAVIEMGMEGKGSIDYNSSIVRPDIAVITNIGRSHIANFPEDGREGILKTKLEICNYFDEHCTLIINTDNDMLAKLNTEEFEIKGDLVTVGSSDNADFKISSTIDKGSDGIEFQLKTNEGTYDIALDVPGAHNAVNASIAVAVALKYGILPQKAIEALKTAELTEKRLSIKEKDGIVLIDDTYNAAPESMKSAINTLVSTEKKPGCRHIAILGDMGELGSSAVAAHREVGKYAHLKMVDVLIAIGELSAEMLEGWKEASAEEGGKIIEFAKEPYVIADEKAMIQAEHFMNIETVMQGVKNHLKPGDIVLLKASRFMALDKIVKIIMGE